MATLEGLKRQIDTATDLGSVVTTMKTLAAVNIRQFEDAAEAVTAYSRTIELGFRIAVKPGSLRLTELESPGRTGTVVIGSDQGMCGPFNEEVVTLFRDRHRDEAPRSSWTLFVVGARAQGPLEDSGVPIRHRYPTPGSVSETTSLVHALLPDLESWREEESGGRILLFYNRRTSASSFEPQQVQLLPIPSESLRRWQSSRWESRSLPTFATNRQTLLSRLIRQHLFASLFRACAESLAAENASRIAAMQAAEKNIEERLDELQGNYNRLRQRAITEELLDVVSGFEALSG